MDNQQNFEFITEKVKERPINKKKLIRKTLLTVSMAAIFGIIACLTFALLEPIINNWLHPQEKIEKIEIPLVSEEILPEDMLEHEEAATSEEVLNSIKNEMQLDTKDYQKLYQSIHNLVLSVQSAEVTITGVSTEVDLFQSAYESTAKSIGYIFAQTSSEIMIMAEYDSVLQNESLEITFIDGSRETASIRGVDTNTNLAVLTVDKKDMSLSTQDVIGYLNLGSSSLSTLIASPVIAMGSPLGHRSVVYGMITSVDTVISMADRNYKLLTTDIYGSEEASGILMDLNGKVVGIIHQNHNAEGMENLISALGISEIKVALQRISNGDENAYIGIRGADLPTEVSKTKDVPVGVYVTEIEMGSPAMEAGIQSGDIIIRMDKSKIITFADYGKVLNTWTPGETKDIYLMRKGQDGYKSAKVQIVVGSW